MKTSLKMGPVALGLMISFGTSAQDHSQHQMPATPPQDHAQHQMPVPTTQDHSDHQAHPKPKPKAKTEPASSPGKPAKPVDHAAMGHAPPDPAVDHSAMGHGTPAAHDEHSAHSAMGHETPPQESEVDHAAMGHAPQPVSPTSEVDHAAMGHAAPHPPEQPITPIPVLTDEDRADAVRPASDHPVHDNGVHSFVLFNRLEGFDTDEGSGLEWEGQAWFGTDRNKLWLRTEGERVGGHTEAADLEVLYGRPFARWWDFVAGIRHDFKPGDSQDFVAIGVAGLAPYKFEVEATAYIGERGQTAARLEVEYETLLTNRLILQPLVEVNLHGRDDQARGIGSGLSTAEIGLRLRYEIRREIAPYVGVVHERAFGRTADFRREEGEDIEDTRLVAGIRIWF